MQGLKVMAVLTRPDAVTLSPEGALAEVAAAGAEVDVLVASLGGASPSEVLDAARGAGARDVYALGLGERRLEDVDPATIIERLVEHVRLLRPGAIVVGQVTAWAADDGAGPWDPDLAVLAELVDASIAAAADPGFPVPSGRPAHRVWIVDVPELDVGGVAGEAPSMVLVA